MAKNSNCTVSRVMHKGPNWDAENEALLDDFSCVNTGIEFCALDDTELGEEWVRRDQVILNDDLLFDFDESTKRLVVTCLDPQGMGSEFKQFREHCQKRARSKQLEWFLMSSDGAQESAEDGFDKKRR